MAEENNEDMSMEDILSSIKDILSDETPPSVTTTLEAEVENEIISAAPVQVEEVDDVLDLSPSMRIASPFEEEVVDTSPFPFESDEESDPLSLDEMLDGSSPIFDIEDSAEANELFDDEDEVSADSLLDSDSDPFYEENISTPSYQELEASNYVAEPEEVLSVEPEAEEEYIYEEAPRFEPIPEPEEVYAPAPAPAPIPVQEMAESDAVDVSANIISNFAKMFAKEEVPAPVAKTAYVPEARAEIIGNGTKTIEDVVVDVIRNIIGDEVAANWRQAADYDHFATQEIQSQTKAWLDANLPTLVERIVKQEIERVMAKVGSHQ